MFVGERRAIVQAAWLSPGGHFLLIDEFTPVETGPVDHRLVLLTTDHSRAPEVLMSTTRTDLLVVGNAWYDAAFIDSGPFSGKLLIERKTYPAGELRLIDPNDPGKTIWTSDQIDYVDRLRVWSLSGGLLLPLNSQSSSALPALYVTANGKTVVLALPIRYGDSIAAVWEIDGRLVYVLQNGSRSGAGLLSSVYSVPLTGTTSIDSAPTEVVSSVSVPADGGPEPWSYAIAGQSWSFGPGLLAAIQQGQLEARAYDGTISLPLEGQVLALYALRR